MVDARLITYNYCILRSGLPITLSSIIVPKLILSARLHDSGQHCSVKRAEKHVVFLKDLSTNGTFVNGKKIGKGRQIALAAGQEFMLIRTPQEKISYLFFLADDKTKEEEGGPEQFYNITETLGTGAFATVKVAVKKEDGSKYAVKIIDKKKFAMNHGSTRQNALMVRTCTAGRECLLIV